MRVVHGLLIGCGALVGISAASGVFVLRRVGSVNAALNREVALAQAASDYQRGVARIRLASQMHTLGVQESELIRREGLRIMASSRETLAVASGDPVVRGQLAEIERVERLTVSASQSLFASPSQASHIDPRVTQRLNFLEARAEALNIGVDAFAERRREHVGASLASMQTTQRVVGVVIGGSICLAVLLALLLARRISRPIGQLSRGVAELSAGNFNHVIELHSGDEIEDFARGFNQMTGTLRDARARLEQRNHDLSRVLDNVAQGLVTVDQAGTLSPECSLAVTQWFGPIKPAQTLWDYLAPFNATFAATFKIGWEAVLEDILPRELTLWQLPRQLVAGGRTWEFAYRPIAIGDDQTINALLLVITDVTERLVAELAEVEQRAFVALVERMLRDREGVVGFINEANQLVAAIAKSRHPSPVLLRRQVHTLKGNAATFGLLPVESLCQKIEDNLAENESGPSDADRELLLATWKHWTAHLTVFLDDGREQSVAMNDDEYDEILLAVIRNAPRQRLAEMLVRLRLEPARPRLLRLGEQATSIASRLGKGPVRVVIEDNAVRVPRDKWRSLWSALIHVVRNGVDHGLETAEVRRAAGKPETGCLTLRTRTEGNQIIIEVADDGGGIDWKRVSRRAIEHRLPAGTLKDLTRALFADGLSTAASVTDVSGRGVGLAAVLAECEQLGGTVEVASVPGQGTTFTFILPAPDLDQVEPRLILLRQAS